MNAFKNGQRVQICIGEPSPLIGLTGTVVRLRRADEAAWVAMDAVPAGCENSFPFYGQEGDPREKSMLLYPRECREVQP